MPQLCRRLATAACFSLLTITASAQQKPAPSTPQGTKAPVAEPQDDTINPYRPGIADGSAVIGPHRFQLEIGGQYEFHGEGGANVHLWFVPTLLRFGINDKWEARVETASYTRARSFDPIGGKSTTDGYSPVSFGAKYHWQDGKGPKKPSLGAIVRVFRRPVRAISTPTRRRRPAPGCGSRPERERLVEP